MFSRARPIRTASKGVNQVVIRFTPNFAPKNQETIISFLILLLGSSSPNRSLFYRTNKVALHPFWVAELYGYKKVHLGAAGYAVSATTEFSKKYFNKGLKEKVRLTIQGQVLDAAEEKCQETYLMMSYSDQNMGVVIVPDTISFPKASRHASYLLADYSPKYDTKEFRNYMDSDEFRYQKEFTEDELLSVSTQSEIYDESIGSSGVVILWQFILVWYLSSAGQHSLH